jgi:short-subunit dehydrogenase involved in D-alanine esterification of teichoic acids
LRYAEFVVPMVKAIQEQQEMIDAKDVRLDEQQATNEQQQEMMELMKGSMETKDVRLDKQGEMMEAQQKQIDQLIELLKQK